MENVKFKRCVISDVSYCCGLLTFTVNTKGFKRYSTGLKRIQEVLENAFDEHSGNMLLTELYRAEHNSFDDDNKIVRGGHSYFNGIVCKYVVDFYYSSAEHFKDDTYVKSMLCVFSVYLKDSTFLSDVLLSDGLLSGLFTSDTTEDTSDTTEDTSDTTEDTSDTTEDTSFALVPRWFYQRANIYAWSAVLSAFNAVFYSKDRRKRIIVKPTRISPRQCFPVRIFPYSTLSDYPYKMLVDGLGMWDCRSLVYNMYLADLICAPPDDELPF